MKIPVGDFGYAVPDRGPQPNLPLGPQPGAALEELGATGMRIAGKIQRSEEFDQQLAYRASHEERLKAEEQARRAEAASAHAAHLAYQNDAFDTTQALLGQLKRGDLTRDDLPDAFASAMSTLAKKHLANVPEGLKADVANQIGATELAQRHAIVQGLAQDQHDEVAAAAVRTREEVERRAVRDLPGAQRIWNNFVDEVIRPEFGAAKAEDMKASFSESSTLTHFDARMLDAGAGRDIGALASLGQEITQNEALAPAQKTRLLERLATTAARAQGENASDLEIAVGRGQAGYRQIEEAFHTGVITPAKRTELTVRLDEHRRKEQEQLAAQREALGRVSSTLEGKAVLDFREKADRDANDYYYSSVMVPSIERNKLDPMQRKALIADYVSATGIIPSPVKGEIRGALRAGDPMAKADAADFLDRLKSSNPQVLNDFDDKDIRLANTIGSYVRAGVEPLSAVALAQKSLDVSAAEGEVRKERYTKLKAEEKNAKWLKDKMIGGSTWRTVGAMLGALPAQVPDALAGEFEQLTREEFVRSGDLDAARTTAIDNLRQVWGVTRASSDKTPRFMKYAPETVYHVEGVDPGWVREQLLKEAPKNAFVDEKPDLLLAADSRTAREARPSYVVMNRRNGVLEPVWGDDGRPVRFRPDFGTSPAGERLRKEHEAEHAEGLKILEGERARRNGSAPQPSGEYFGSP